MSRLLAIFAWGVGGFGVAEGRETQGVGLGEMSGLTSTCRGGPCPN